MTKAEQLESEFRNRGVLDAGLLLLRPADAIELVNRCREESLAILGIDAFELRPAKTQPVMEDSIDFSSENVEMPAADIWDEAELFLRQRQHKDLFFEIVIEPR